MTHEMTRRATAEEIVARRNKAVAIYEKAHKAVVEAEALLKSAREMSAQSPAEINSYNHFSDRERKDFLSHIEVPQHSSFMQTATRLADVSAWSRIIEMTDLERLMDKKAKDEFRQQLMRDPPEVTVDNIMATLEQFMLDAEMIFKRGIAECFSNLDRRFRSHDGWKIGSRVILSYAFGETGHWNYGSNHRDTLHDIERTFMVIEGCDVPQMYSGLVGAIEEARRVGWGARQTEICSDFFTIRIFKNGNAHIWFKRDDLLEKVNKLLGEYYGAPLPEERSPTADTGLHNPKTDVAKNYGFYPTPPDAADFVFDKVPMGRRDGAPRLTVLEPSAGQGSLACRAAKAGAIVDCVEIFGDRAEDLRNQGFYRHVYHCDFLGLHPDLYDLYDRVVMNPPFDRERDIDHVMHAMKFLKPDGILVAVMSAGTEFRETKKSQAFREYMAELGAIYRDLPPRSFASVGTCCNTIILKVHKDGRRQTYM